MSTTLAKAAAIKRSKDIFDVEKAMATVITTELAPTNDSEAIVHESAMLLDEIRPNWFNEINLSTFDLFSGDNCIVGQLYGTYDGGGRRAWWNAAAAHASEKKRSEITYSFINGVPADGNLSDWGTKSEWWRKEIEFRRA